MENFKFNHPIQMRWNDLDALGHVNNAIYISYFEIARGRFMSAACEGWDWTKHMFLIANVNVDFKTELLLTASTTKVHVKTNKIGSKSFVLDYLITSEKSGETIVHATGSSTQIMFDMAQRRTIEIPDWVREGLKAFDKL